MNNKSIVNKNTWIIVLIGFVSINLIASFFHQRFDLTEEKRYSLSKPTKELLSNLQQPVRIEVLMKGDFPAGFRNLANSVAEFLQECKEYGRGNIQYIFVDPFKTANDSAGAFIERNRTEIAKDPSANEKQISAAYAKYYIDSISNYYGIPAYTLQAPAKVGDEQTEKTVLPGAIIYYKDTAIGVSLFQGAKFFGTEPEQLAALYNNVAAAMEYNFASAIQKVTAAQKPTIGYALGNGEGWGYNVNDAVRTLVKNYAFDTVNIKQSPYIPPYNALVILKPTISFSNNDKLKIDQYVMHGGKVFWMIDNMYAEFDSLYKSKGFIAFDRGLNLEDILFNYGVRINQTLLQDMQCDKLPQVSGEGTTQQQRLVDWPFFPIFNGTDHPISKNLDGVRAMFPTTIDTVEAKGISKTFLLQSSNNARLLQAPAKIDFQFLQIAPDIREFQHKNVPVAVLLEGNFRSLYTGRVPKGMADSLRGMNQSFVTTSESNKMIIVSDGDIAFNPYSQTSGPLPMGTNVFTRYTYANKDFFTNCLEYLVNPTDILQTRAKEYTLRLLDPKKTVAQKGLWQFINIALPVIIIILLAIAYQQLRKNRFTVK